MLVYPGIHIKVYGFFCTGLINTVFMNDMVFFLFTASLLFADEYLSADNTPPIPLFIDDMLLI
jgi:hypothetical protein